MKNRNIQSTIIYLLLLFMGCSLLMQFFGNSGNDLTYSQVMDRLEAQQVSKLVDTCLTEQERQVVCMRYGLFGTIPKRQREVAELAAFGLSNKEIAARMGMSLSAVKQALLSVTDKTGVGRDEFAGFL